MKHKFHFLAFLSCMVFFMSSFAQQDTASKSKRSGEIIVKISDTLWFRIYNPEQGYFQKANFDKSDPRFMVSNENQTFKFGIGGTVKLVAFTDFAGAIPKHEFVTSLIPVPTDNYGQFDLFANYSRLNVKTAGKINGSPIVSFIEGSFSGTGNAFTLRHAYVSFLGLTVGRTWSTFMDLQASPPTIDGEGPNNQIALRHPMIRYTYYKNKLQAAFAVEMSDLLMDSDAVRPFGIYYQEQRIPDFITHVKYENKFGHVQLGALLSIINYGDSSQTKKSLYIPGGGLSLSGTFNLWKEAKLYYQLDGGKGIANYIQDLSLFDYDLLPTFTEGKKVNTTWMYGGYLAFQQYWTKKIHSNLVYGITRLETPKGDKTMYEQHIPWYYKHGQYCAVNTFWNFFDFAHVGMEYVWGEKCNLNGIKGHAHRINLLLQYDF